MEEHLSVFIVPIPSLPVESKLLLLDDRLALGFEVRGDIRGLIILSNIPELL